MKKYKNIKKNTYSTKKKKSEIKNMWFVQYLFQSIYVDMVSYLPDMLQDASDLMTEKELRIRTPLEELDILLAANIESSATSNTLRINSA